MPRIVYVNGRYLPYAEASVHVEDRGFQLPTLSMRSARCAMAASSTRPGTWRVWRAL